MQQLVTSTVQLLQLGTACQLGLPLGAVVSHVPDVAVQVATSPLCTRITGMSTAVELLINWAAQHLPPALDKLFCAMQRRACGLVSAPCRPDTVPTAGRQQREPSQQHIHNKTGVKEGYYFHAYCHDHISYAASPLTRCHMHHGVYRSVRGSLT